ncbi:MAG: hypothetical protein LBU42_01635 [Prevotellaceae bacterium]|nr:hypothetical protein [Prevotellaceae bacterium]
MKKSIHLNAHLSTLLKLPELIETARLKDTHADKNSDTNVKEIQRLYNSIKYEEKVYPVKITVKSIKNNRDKVL